MRKRPSINGFDLDLTGDQTDLKTLAQKKISPGVKKISALWLSLSVIVYIQNQLTATVRRVVCGAAAASAASSARSACASSAAPGSSSSSAAAGRACRAARAAHARAARPQLQPHRGLPTAHSAVTSLNLCNIFFPKNI